MDDIREDLISIYFRMGLTQKEILTVLAVRHQIVISIRHLRRLLNACKLTRRKNFSDIFEVAIFIENQLKASGCLHGYRWMHTTCLHEGFVVRKEDVRILLRMLDPEGVEIRSKRRLRRRSYISKGPNFIWHLDGYDKLKPYGVCISGCIDGFSRYIMWLKAYYTNNDPRVIAGYFLETVAEVNGCPTVVRGDCGTENCNVRKVQKYLRRNGFDIFVPKCYMEGRSTANQRIEAWWGQLRSHCSQFWIDTLTQLKDDGDFTGSIMDKCIVQYCFMHIIQEELDEVVRIWNSHNIRAVKNSLMPHGKPFIMYTVPSVHNAVSHLCNVDGEDFDRCLEECDLRSDNPCMLPEMKELLQIYADENNWNEPGDVNEAIQLYKALRQLALTDLNL